MVDHDRRAPGTFAQKIQMVEIEYLGPNGAGHPDLGLLETGHRYLVTMETAKIWTTNSPDHWRLVTGDGAEPAPKE